MLAVLGAGLQTLDFNFEVALDPEEQPRSRDTSVQQSALLAEQHRGSKYSHSIGDWRSVSRAPTPFALKYHAVSGIQYLYKKLGFRSTMYMLFVYNCRWSIARGDLANNYITTVVQV